jgi:hypothetical protein
MPYTAPALPEAGLRLRSRRVRGNRCRRPKVWFVVPLLAATMALMAVLSGASSGATWTVRGPGFSVVLPGVALH